MATLSGTNINLRALEPNDLNFLYQIENNEMNWAISNTQKPFSKFLLKQYLENAHQDIYEAKQLRLIITENINNNSIGLIDLFNYEPKHNRAGIGILIHPKYEHNGYASEALKQLIEYAFTHIDIHQLYANITEDNLNSINLFEKFNFQKVGAKKDWIYVNGIYKNELLYQLIHE